MNGRIWVWLNLLTLPAAAAPLLSIDFNHRTNNLALFTQPGFTSFLINSNISSATSPQTNATVRMVGTNRVTLTGNGLNRGYTDRTRVLPTNQGAFTESLLLRDCVFSPDETTNGGLNVLIENLPLSNRVQVTVWSFDALSFPVRASDWYANGVRMREAYQFDDSVLPVRNDQYRFSFICVVDGRGQLMIQGRRNDLSKNSIGADQPGVFLNALRIDPEPLEILRIQPAANELTLTFVVWPQPGDYVVEENTGTQWQAMSGVSYSAPTNNRVVARFARPSATRYYRVRYAY